MIKPLVCVTDGLQLEATALAWEGKIDDVVATAVKLTSSIQWIEWKDQSEDIQPPAQHVWRRLTWISEN